MWSRKFDKKRFIKFYKKGTRKFFKKGIGKRRRSCGQCGRERSGAGNMGQAGHQARIPRRSQSIKNMRNCRPGRTAESRENPPTMTPDDPPPRTFKEDIERMSEAFPAEREGQHLYGVTGSTKIGRG
jgi:hypothetical protein